MKCLCKYWNEGDAFCCCMYHLYVYIIMRYVIFQYKVKKNILLSVNTYITSFELFFDRIKMSFLFLNLKDLFIFELSHEIIFTFVIIYPLVVFAHTCEVFWIVHVSWMPNIFFCEKWDSWNWSLKWNLCW